MLVHFKLIDHHSYDVMEVLRHFDLALTMLYTDGKQQITVLLDFLAVLEGDLLDYGMKVSEIATYCRFTEKYLELRPTLGFLRSRPS